MDTPLLLDGRRVARHIYEDIAARVHTLRAQGVNPCLATILVGEDGPSVTYVRMKKNACQRAGITSRAVHLPQSTTTAELIRQIQALNTDPTVHGILLQHPVPEHIDERSAFDAIALHKDVDGVTSLNFGYTAMGLPCIPAATPHAIMRMLDYYSISLSGKHAVVIGRSPILGRPLAMLLLQRDATVTICHSRTQHLADIVRTADIVLAACRQPQMVQGDWLKQGAVVIDAGYNAGNVGDVDFSSCLARSSAITPVPGGVGPVTIAMLLLHTVEASEAALAEAGTHHSS